MNVRKLMVNVLVSFIITSVLCLSYAEASKLLISRSWKMQQDSQWCWVACAQNSVINVLGKAESQESGVKYIHGSKVNKGANNAQTARVAEYLSNDVLVYGHTATGTKKGFSFLKGKIDVGYVTILSSGCYEGTIRKYGHDVLMTGYDTTGGNHIYYYDPLDGKVNFCTYKSFVNGTYNGAKYDGTIYNVC
ncbi:MAG: C39 family peptidase [Eubacteriales bacterium]|nr:C39 family peptidase [Eubacteriales bacterium]